MEKSTDKCNHLKCSVARIQKGTCFVVLLRSHTTSCRDLGLILVALCWVHFYVFAFLWFSGTCAFKLKVTESLWWRWSVLMNRLSQIMMISQKQAWFAADIFQMYKTIKVLERAKIYASLLWGITWIFSWMKTVLWDLLNWTAKGRSFKNSRTETTSPYK